MAVRADERELQSLWARVLNIKASTIGLDSSFFRLGGDSITTMRLLSECGKKGLCLSVSDVLRHPKLIAMAPCVQCIGEGQLCLDEDQLLPFSFLGDVFTTLSNIDIISTSCGIDMKDIEDAYPCTPLQEG